MSKKVIVVGGGPAGIMAAIAAAENGAQVELWERNKTLGRKLAITGKGRCNITNACGVNELIKNIPGNGTFLYSAFSRWNADDTMRFFSECGLELKTERGKRVFPASDSAMDVVDCLQRKLDELNVNVRYGLRAKRLQIRDGAISGLHDFSGALHNCDAVIIASGGKSYPATGSSGDGYALAEQAGHRIIEPKGALVPLEIAEEWPKQLAGLSLKNASLELLDGEKVIDRAFGEMLFTHFGISGPIVLSLSRAVSSSSSPALTLLLDLKPALSEEQLDERLQRNAQKFSRKIFANSLGELLPASLIPIFISLSGIPAEKAVNQLSRKDRATLISLFKGMKMSISGTRPIEEAIVTAGGVCVKEVLPKTMESRLCKNLLFAGEVLDIDGFTGGFNLQAAWATGRIAGCCAAE